jgi:CRISPR-associated protein Csx17
MPTLQIHGCALEPLGDYLKALGILRLVSEQITSEARCWWDHGVFHLWLPGGASYPSDGCEVAPLPQADAERRSWLEKFFLNACEFSPVIAPWQKNTGWHPEDTGESSEKGTAALNEAVHKAPRSMAAFVRAMRELSASTRADTATHGKESANSSMPETNSTATIRRLLTESGYSRIERRRQMFHFLRNSVSDPKFTSWIDTVAHPSQQWKDEITWFRLLGKTGAGEGRGAYVATLNAAYRHALTENSLPHLKYSLWHEQVSDPVDKRFSIGLFYPSRKGDPNMGQSFDRQESGNAWDVILLFEGVLLFAGSVARRMNARRAAPAFPFYCASSLGGNLAAGLTEIEGSQKGTSSGEVWCPVWSQPATLRDLSTLFSEGRMQVAGRDTRLATQFIRALGRYGCDRGIAAFQRYGLLRRSGSFGKQDQTSTLAVPLGLYTVSPNSDLMLLDEFFDYESDILDASGQRAIVSSSSQPQRIVESRRRFEQALFEASRAGLESHKESIHGVTDFQLKLIEVATAAANLERECGVTDGRIHNREGKMSEKGSPNVPCIPSLSYDWLRLRHAASSEAPKLADLFDDATAEWRLARAIGTICPWRAKPESSRRTESPAVGPIRENLARVVRSEAGEFWTWEPESRRAVWSSGRDLLTNCAAVLQRRLLDAQSASGKGIPLFSPYGARAADVLALWQAKVDAARLEELLHAFALVRPWEKRKAGDNGGTEIPDAEAQVDLETTAEEAESHAEGDSFEATAELPRPYALLKLCFLGGRLPARSGAKRTGDEPWAPGNLAIFNLLMAGRGDEACTAAARRLHFVGYPALFATSQSFSAGFEISPEQWRRIAGLLLVPITFGNSLAKLILKPLQEDPS